MIKRISFLFVLFFCCAFSLSAQVNMNSFRLRRAPGPDEDYYFVRLNDSLCSCRIQNAWIFFGEPEDTKLFSSVLFKVSELLEKEVYVKCDTIVPVKFFITYNAANEPCNIIYRVPERYINCFSEPVFNEIYSLFVTMSPDLSINALLDNLWNKYSKVSRQQSEGFIQLIFELDKRFWDWLKEESAEK